MSCRTKPLTLRQLYAQHIKRVKRIVDAADRRKNAHFRLRRKAKPENAAKRAWAQRDTPA